jgi:uncharacterized protein (TIGR04222 family)
MNPLDLPGLSFFALFAVVGLAVLAVVRFLLRHDDVDETSIPLIDDPYKIAWLRGGTREAARAAVVSLIQSGALLTADEEIVRTAPPSSSRPAFEKAILSVCGQPIPGYSAVAQFAVDEAGAHCQGELAALGLVLTPEAKQRRVLICRGAALALSGFAVLKLLVDLSRGQSDALPVLGLLAVALAFLIATGSKWRTTRGKRALADVCHRWGLGRQEAGLRLPAGMSEAAVVVALFGLDALPESAFASVHRVLQPPSTSTDGA